MTRYFSSYDALILPRPKFDVEPRDCPPSLDYSNFFKLRRSYFGSLSSERLKCDFKMKKIEEFLKSCYTELKKRGTISIY